MLSFNEENHEYVRDGIVLPSVTQILIGLGFIDTTWFTEESRNRGDAVHLAIKNRLNGAMCHVLSPEIALYFDAYLNFERDCDWKCIEFEKSRACNLYAGTPDQFGYMNNHLSVLDVKTGGISPATGLQLQGYKDLWIYTVKLVNPLMKRFALQLTKEGKYKLTEYKDKSDEHIFRAAVSIFWWKRNHGI